MRRQCDTQFLLEVGFASKRTNCCWKQTLTAKPFRPYAVDENSGGTIRRRTFRDRCAFATTRAVIQISLRHLIGL